MEVLNMWTYNYSTELYHHGVLGMKWGVRRYQNKDGSLTNAGRKRQAKSNSSEAHPDYTRAHSKKSVKSMSDSELQKTNNRLNMERQYKSLTTKETSKGKKFVQKAIVGAAVAGVTIAVGNRIRSASSAATDKVIDKAIALGKEVIEYGNKYGYSFIHSDLTDYDELYHHGVLGMKWGVRRYQNFDGSYTRAGMKRFNNSLREYEKANSRYKKAKKSESSKTEVTNSRMARKKAKHQLNKDYKHLKQDKLGDKGKDLYSRGHTITGHSKVTSMLSTIGSISASVAAYNYKAGMLGDKKVTAILAGAGALSLSAAGVKGVYDNVRDRRLRAYYGHTSNY